MTDLKSWDRNLVAVATFGVVFLLFVLTYFLPRLAKIEETRTSIEKLRSSRQEVSILLPQVARTAFTTPVPDPDVRTWVANNALSGLEQNLVVNDGYLQGQGAQVKLRRMQPSQAARFMSNLTRVRLVIEKMDLQDSDMDGRWDLDISLKVPEAR